MIVLDSTLKTLEIVLGGAVTTTQLPFVAVYVDVTTSAYTPIENDGATNDTTAVTMVAAPAASTQRQIKFLSVQNEDTVNATVIIQYNDNGTTRRISKFTLSPDDTLLYTDGEGMRVLDSTGSLKQSSSGSSVTSVSGTANRITSTGGLTPIIDIDTNYVGQNSINTLGTIGTGVWQATLIDKAYGGTGVNIANAALLLGTASTTAGQLTLSNATNAFTQTFRGTNPAASITYDLPTTAPTAGQVLQSTAPAAGIVTLSWASAGGGISVGTTTITTGLSTATSRRIGYNLAGVYQEALNELYFELASPFAHVFAAGRTGVITGVRNSLYGYKAGETITSSTDNAIFGHNAGVLLTTTAANYNSYFGSGSGNNTGGKNTGIGYIALQNGTGSENTAVGYTSQSVGTGNGTLNSSLGSQSLLNRTSGNRNVAVGAESLVTLTSGSFNVALGYAACYTGNLSGTIGIGYYANPTASNTGVIGSNQSESKLDAIYFNNPTSSGGAIYDIILSASGGSGSNAASANMSLQGGAPTGTSTTGGALNLRGYTALGSGSTAQTATTVLQITNATTVTVSNAVNFVFNATTGTKLGTATTQKLGFWNTTPIVQPTTAVASATVVSGTSGNVKHDDTFDGYTVEQIVRALRNTGLLA